MPMARPHRFSPRIILKIALALAITIAICLLASRLSANKAAGPEKSLMKSTKAHYDYKQQHPKSFEKINKVESKALRDYAVRRLVRGLKTKNFLEFAYRLRLFGDIFDAYRQNYHKNHRKCSMTLKGDGLARNGELTRNFGKNSTVPLSKQTKGPLIPYPASALLWHLEKELFPWAHTKFASLQELKASYRGKGIVIPTGSQYLRFAIHLVRQIKHLGCKLPITIAYAGENDLKANELAFLQRMDVNTMDVTTCFDPRRLELGGWEIKPFALLASPYEQVIMADADIVFLQNPELMLDDPGYLEHGAIIFHDRTLFEGDKGKDEWLNANLPRPLSDRVRNSRMYQRKTAHEQESGVVVWDKHRRFNGLLAACKMNVKAEREAVTYKIFYGDKESFWIGLEMAGQSFTDLQPTPGVIGFGHWDEKKDQLVACGRILHFDRQGWPLWFNGAIVTNKRDGVLSNEIMNFTYFAREGTWDFATSCVDHDVTPINSTLKALINDIISLWVPKIDYDGLTESSAI